MDTFEASKKLSEHHKYTIKISLNTLWNIAYILLDHHYIYYRTSHVYYVNTTKNIIEHLMYNTRTSHMIITCVLEEHHKKYHK